MLASAAAARVKARLAISTFGIAEAVPLNRDFKLRHSLFHSKIDPGDDPE